MTLVEFLENFESETKIMVFYKIITYEALIYKGTVGAMPADASYSMVVNETVVSGSVALGEVDWFSGFMLIPVE